jgi:hypothetical protein
LERLLGSSVQVVTREEWDSANHPGGEPVLLPQPLSPFRAVELTGKLEVAVTSARPWADQPGYHNVRRDPADAPKDINLDSHNAIFDLSSHYSWRRVLEVTGMADSAELRARVQEHVFLVPTWRDDHRSERIPDDIAGAKPKIQKPLDESGEGAR